MRQDITRDVERPILSGDFLNRDHAGTVRHIGVIVHPAQYRRGVFGIEEVLRTALAKQRRGIHNEHRPGFFGFLAAAQDEDAGGQACPIEEIRRQADGGLPEVGFELQEGYGWVKEFGLGHWIGFDPFHFVTI